MYLTPIDFASKAHQDYIDYIADGDKYRLTKAEMSAVKFAKGQLQARYDIDKIFIPCKEHVQAQLYSAGALVYWRADEESDYQIYQAITDTNQAPNNDTFWTPQDPRDQYILDILVSLTVYNFLRPDAEIMPKDVYQSRKEARSDLIAIGRGEMLADLPAKPEPEEDQPDTGDIRFDSQPLEENRW